MTTIQTEVTCRRCGRTKDGCGCFSGFRPVVKPEGPPAPPEWRDMEPLEIEAAIMLGGCRFLPGSPPKKFAQNMAAKATSDKRISKKQAALLWRICYHFRKQLKGAVRAEVQRRYKR